MIFLRLCLLGSIQWDHLFSCNMRVIMQKRAGFPNAAFYVSLSQTLETVISETLNATYSVWIIKVSEVDAEPINVNLLVHQLFATLTNREGKINCRSTYIFEYTSNGVRNGSELLQFSFLAFDHLSEPVQMKDAEEEGLGFSSYAAPHSPVHGCNFGRGHWR